MGLQLQRMPGKEQQRFRLLIHEQMRYSLDLLRRLSPGDQHGVLRRVGPGGSPAACCWGPFVPGTWLYVTISVFKVPGVSPRFIRSQFCSLVTLMTVKTKNLAINGLEAAYTAACIGSRPEGVKATTYGFQTMSQPNLHRQSNQKCPCPGQIKTHKCKCKRHGRHNIILFKILASIF